MEPLNYNHTAQDFWNYGDLNRVNEWTLYIKNQLSALGYNASITSRTWKAGDYPTPNKLATIRNNINALKNAWFTPEGWRELKKVTRDDGKETINAEQVNAQEWDLHLLASALDGMIASFPYAGEWFAGEE